MLSSFSGYSNFCLDFLVIQKNGLIKNIRLISKFTTSQSGKLTNARHILPNISRIKGNQTIKFGQLTEYTLRNIFLEKSSTKETRPFSSDPSFPDPFLKHSKLSIYLDQQSKVLYRCFFTICQIEGYKRAIQKLSCRPLAFTSYKVLLKNNKRSETSLPASFFVCLLKKNIFHTLKSTNCPNFIV